MTTQSYFAHTVEEAVRQAQRELGEDALLVESKRAARGGYEVSFALPGTVPHSTVAAPATTASPVVPFRSMTTATEPDASLRRELAGMREQVAQLAATLARSEANRRPERWRSEDAAAWHARLLGQEVDPQVAARLVGLAEQRVLGATPAAPASFAEHLRSARVRTGDDSARWMPAFTAELERALPSNESVNRARVMVVVGPPGAGKTTTLAKIAVRDGLLAGKSTLLLSLDTERVGGADQLQSYANILGLPFEALPAPELLAAAVRRSRHDLILVDTAGYGPREAGAVAALARALEGLPQAAVHLVLPAPWRSADLQKAAARFAPLNPHALLFTRLDETFTVGPVLNHAVRTGLPLSHFGTGQQVPEDLEAPTAANLASRLLTAVADMAEAA